MRRYLLAGLMFVWCIGSLAEAPHGPACRPGEITTANDYMAIQWYRTSAEKNALYREIFSMAEQQVRAKKRFLKLEPQQWGVVFDIDDTLLDNSLHSYENALYCAGQHSIGSTAFFVREVSVPTPGAKKITCDIRKMGGYVSLVSNRDGNQTDPRTGKNLLDATVENLKKAGICFDQVVLANSVNGNKNPRFQAINSGEYPADMIVTRKLPAHRVIAYFGDNIQDFPNTFQQEMKQENPEGQAYANFGISYFVLPNPLYGSWQHATKKP